MIFFFFFILNNHCYLTLVYDVLTLFPHKRTAPNKLSDFKNSTNVTSSLCKRGFVKMRILNTNPTTGNIVNLVNIFYKITFLTRIIILNCSINLQ